MQQSVKMKIQHREAAAQDLRQASFYLTVNIFSSSKPRKNLLTDLNCSLARCFAIHKLQLVESLLVFPLLCSLQRSARAAAENSDAVFSELIQSIELKRFEVRELVKAQEKKAIGQAEQLLERMRREIAELKASEAELSKLTAVEDSIQFLQVSSFLLVRHLVPGQSITQHISDPARPSRVARLSKRRPSYQLCLRSLPSLA